MVSPQEMGIIFSTKKFLKDVAPEKNVNRFDIINAVSDNSIFLVSSNFQKEEDMVRAYGDLFEDQAISEIACVTLFKALEIAREEGRYFSRHDKYVNKYFKKLDDARDGLNKFLNKWGYQLDMTNFNDYSIFYRGSDINGYINPIKWRSETRMARRQAGLNP